jgi:hypothetical protein
VRTLAGSRERGFRSPRTLALDERGRLLVVESDIDHLAWAAWEARAAREARARRKTKMVMMA